MVQKVALVRHISWRANYTWLQTRLFRSYLDEPTNDPDIEKAVKLLKSRGVDVDNPMVDQNAFKLFNIEQRFLVNTSALRREMQTLQKLVHPDRFVQSDTRTIRTSERLSMIINEAHQLLASPYHRAKYLLGLMTGKNHNEIEQNLDRLQMDPEFLSRMMDLQEKLGNLLDQRELTIIRDDLQREQDKLMAQINEDFETKNHDHLLEKIGRLKFIYNCYNIADQQLSTQGDNF